MTHAGYCGEGGLDDYVERLEIIDATSRDDCEFKLGLFEAIRTSGLASFEAERALAGTSANS